MAWLAFQPPCSRQPIQLRIRAPGVLGPPAYLRAAARTHPGFRIRRKPRTLRQFVGFIANTRKGRCIGAAAIREKWFRNQITSPGAS
jgi:hypothetical protein